MHYNPYESKKSRRDRILSDILIVAIVAMFIWGLYSVFVGNRKRIMPFEFTETEAVQQADTDANSEFDALYRYASEMKEETVKGEEFAAAFPLASALLDMDTSVYREKTPYFCVDSGHLVLAQTVLSVTADCRELEVMMAECSHQQEDGSLSVSLRNFNVYTVVYNARNGILSFKEYETSQFHINLFSLSVSAEGAAPTECRYEVTLKCDQHDENQCKQLVYDPVNATYGDPQVETQDGKTVIRAVQNSDSLAQSADKATYSLRTADGGFYSLDEVNFAFTFANGASPELHFYANR